VKDVVAIERYDSMDIAFLRNLRDLTLSLGNPSRFSDLINLFLNSLQTDLESLRKALREHDTLALREVAHELKGTSANLGAICLAALCGVLEEACMSPEVDGAERIVQEIEAQAQAVGQIMLWEAECGCQ
jgi:HPt (histidine-containing phosphotransfer) domain-containing protein